MRKRWKKIHPWQRTPYAGRVAPNLHVVLVDSQDDLYDYIGDRPESGHAGGCTIHLDLNVCEIVLQRGVLDPETITHEATHAAIWILKAERQRHQLSIGFDEEPLAYLVGSITRQICQFLEKVT